MKLLTSLFYLAVCISLSYGQNSPDKTDLDVKSMIASQNFTIDVESVSPARGGYRRLSTGYLFDVSPDTLTTDLPYFGRAYQAPMSPGDAGIKFASLDYEYTYKERKKGGWEVKLKPKDVPRVPQVNLTVSSNGATSIRISPTDREAISYSGTLRMSK